METIKIKSVTEYFAKKRILQESFIFFRKNPEQEQVKVISKYKDPQKGKIKLTIARDELIEQLGYDFTKEWNRLVKDKSLYHKNDILAFYEKLTEFVEN
jgi:hypothetical protein